MKINTKIIKLNAPGFCIDRICRQPGRENTCLFDSTRREMLLLSPTYQVIHRLELKSIPGIQQIDTAFFTGENLVIADSLAKTLFRIRLDIDSEDGKGGQGNEGGEGRNGRT